MNDCGGSLTKAHMFVLLREYSGKILFPLLILLFPQTAISYFLKFNVTYFGKCGRYYCFWKQLRFCVCFNFSRKVFLKSYLVFKKILSSWQFCVCQPLTCASNRQKQLQESGVMDREVILDSKGQSCDRVQLMRWRHALAYFYWGISAEIAAMLWYSHGASAGGKLRLCQMEVSEEKTQFLSLLTSWRNSEQESSTGYSHQSNYGPSENYF